MTQPAEALNFTVDGLAIAGLGFGPPDGTPVLALHGWLDNAASFTRLAAALPDCRIVALDLPGHGQSDHRSPDAAYQIWDDLPQLAGVLDALGWNNAVLMGHSRGAMIATLLAAAQPERIRALITLDTLLPMPMPDAELPGQLARFLADRKRLAQTRPRHFANIAEFITRRARSGEPPEIAETLAPRALCLSGHGVTQRHDPRLTGASATKLNHDQCIALLQALTMPVLTLWATPRPGHEAGQKKMTAAAARHVVDLTAHHIPGHHHWHMDAKTCPEIADKIRAFLAGKATP